MQRLRNWQVTARELHLLRCITSTQSVRSTSSNLTSCGTHSYWRTWPLCAHSLGIISPSIYRREIQIHPVQYENCERPRRGNLPQRESSGRLCEPSCTHRVDTSIFETFTRIADFRMSSL